MRPRRTHNSNCVFTLPEGNEDNDLWLQRANDADGSTILCSTWVPTPAERARIGDGANVELIVWGDAHPPVAMRVVTYPLGAAPKGTS
jgi:hypothetical protein